MTGYIITKKVMNRWTYYLERLELNGKPVWNGLRCNAKPMNLTNAMLVERRLNEIYQKEVFTITENN